MKIVRKGCQDYESAIMEVRVLEALQEKARSGQTADSRCIEMLDWFDYNGHICIVFEMLGLSIYEFLKRNSYRPFTIDQVQEISYQLCRAVQFCHERGLAHTDLKPENLLFSDSSFDFINAQDDSKTSQGVERRVRRTDIKLIDFGSALFEYESHGSLISTRQYRAPEVLLDVGWSYPADVWSIGCIILELYTGHTLFQTHGTLEHLAMMERVVGSIPASFSTHCPRKSRYFRHGRLDWDSRSRAGRAVARKCRPLKSYMTSSSSLHKELFDLIQSMLQYDPARRVTLRSALRHPFFKDLHHARGTERP